MPTYVYSNTKIAKMATNYQKKDCTSSNFRISLSVVGGGGWLGTGFGTGGAAAAAATVVTDAVVAAGAVGAGMGSEDVDFNGEVPGLGGSDG
jgi:hypothetical protein